MLPLLLVAQTPQVGPDTSTFGAFGICLTICFIAIGWLVKQLSNERKAKDDMIAKMISDYIPNSLELVRVAKELAAIITRGTHGSAS